MDVDIGETGIFEISEADNISISDDGTVTISDITISLLDEIVITDDFTATITCSIIASDGIILGDDKTVSISDLLIAEIDGLTTTDTINLFLPVADRFFIVTDEIIVGENSILNVLALYILSNIYDTSATHVNVLLQKSAGTGASDNVIGADAKDEDCGVDSFDMATIDVNAGEN